MKQSLAWPSMVSEAAFLTFVLMVRPKPVLSRRTYLSKVDSSSSILAFSDSLYFAFTSSFFSTRYPPSETKIFNKLVTKQYVQRRRP